MKLKQKRVWVYIVSSGCLLIGMACLIWTFREEPAQFREISRLDKLQKVRDSLAQAIAPSLLQNQLLPKASITLQDFPGEEKIEASLEYTINSDLQKTADQLLKSYKPDYGAIVILETSTGRVLALSSFQKQNLESSNLALRGTFPAASIFKIVTASAALDKYHVTPDTIVMFNGGNHTLYKKNAMSEKVNRWTREMTLREAFARSINTVFARLTLERLAPQDLEDYAIRFGFNQNIKSDLPFTTGFTEIPKEKNFHLTEMASGFNKVTRMSPIQGAMIASAVAEAGVMRIPYIVERARNPEGKIIFQAEPITVGRTMSPQGAEKLQELMEATITQGTSRKFFRSWAKDKHFRELIVGGKTGSLTGDNPKGKVDWFVGYAMNENQKIAIAALTVNVRYWTVKSSFLAQSMFRTHFKGQFSKNNEKFFNATADHNPGL